jgi:hypothetical protein
MFKKKQVESPWIHSQYEGVVRRFGVAGTFYDETHWFLLLESDPNPIQFRVRGSASASAALALAQTGDVVEFELARHREWSDRNVSMLTAFTNRTLGMGQLNPV